MVYSINYVITNSEKDEKMIHMTDQSNYTFQTLYWIDYDLHLIFKEKTTSSQSINQFLNLRSKPIDQLTNPISNYILVYHIIFQSCLFRRTRGAASWADPSRRRATVDPRVPEAPSLAATRSRRNRDRRRLHA